jgi:arsenical pump membrane protein
VWPAFALVTGLLLIGVVAEQDGLFAAAGARLARLPVGPRVLFLVLLALVALVTAVLNLDTSVFFVTPVAVHLARTRGITEAPFLYGVVFMSNAASLFLPGSNLTNLIVLHHERVSGAAFFLRMWPAAVAAVVSTAAVLLVLFRRGLAEEHDGRDGVVRAQLRVGAAAVVVATVLVLVLPAPALPVLLVGAAAVLLARTRQARVLAAVDVRVLGLLFALAVALGTLGRWWSGPHSLVDSLGRWPDAALGAGASILVNNLPAAVLLTPAPPHHARALLLGLNLGPNLAVSGSLSALLWLRVARSIGARPSIGTYSAIGLVVVPVSLAAALAALSL